MKCQPQIFKPSNSCRVLAKETRHSTYLVERGDAWREALLDVGQHVAVEHGRRAHAHEAAEQARGAAEPGRRAPGKVTPVMQMQDEDGEDDRQ